MTASPEHLDPLWRAIHVFGEHLSAQVHDRWTAWVKGGEERHVHEVVGGLLARQATLARELASNPSIWNAHSAPLILRSMVENCITIAWILKSPDERAREFVTYGLGQENLLLEHAKADLRESGIDPDKDPTIDSWEQWLDSQRFTFLTEVNVGNWATDLRKMAKEVGLIELYRNDYARWSSTTHSMWHHVVRFNLDRESCANPLHGYHRVPTATRLEPDTVFLQRAAEYVDVSIRTFDEATGTNLGDRSAVGVLDTEFHNLSQSPGPEATGDS